MLSAHTPCVGQLGADFVQMWTGTTARSGTCGIAYVQNTFVPTLVSVVNTICFYNYALAHEVRIVLSRTSKAILTHETILLRIRLN
jgi:hypothetical protein